MYYEINIALNGSHFFATAERSITSIDKLEKVLSKLKESFKKEDGYSLSVNYVPQISYGIDATDEVNLREAFKNIG